MTRLTFGGGPEDVYLTQDVSTGYLKPTGGAQALFYADTAKTLRYTDLQTLSGQAISSVTTEAGGVGSTWSTGQIAPFYGPDGIFEMWVSVAGSPVFLMQASNLGSFAGPQLAQLQQLLTRPSPALSNLTDVDTDALAAGTTGQALVKLENGMYGPGTVSSGGGSPANMATTDTTQTITGAKTLAALLTANGGILAKALTTSAVAAIVQAIAAQTSNLQEWRNSAGTALSWVDTTGNLYAPNIGKVFPLSKAGTLSTGTGTMKLYNDCGTALKIKSVRASLGTAASTGTTTFDVKVSGTTIYTVTGNRPSITSGSTTSGKNTAFNAGATIPDGSYLTVDVVAVGTGAADAVVQIDTW